MSMSDRNIAQRTILVAAPDWPNTRTLTTLLRHFGYRVSVAEDAAQALQRAGEAKPSLIISEMVLPDKRDGALYEMFQANNRTSRVPLFFMVPPGDAGAATRCLAFGAGYISKPVQAEPLFHLIQATIEPKPRASMRVSAEVPVMLNNHPVGNPGGTCEINLSEDGMRVPAYEPVPVRSRLSVRIQLNNRTVSAESSVVYAHMPESGSSGMGLHFERITPQDRDVIRQFVNEEIERPLS